MHSAERNVEKLKSVHRASLAELDALFASLQRRARFEESPSHWADWTVVTNSAIYLAWNLTANSTSGIHTLSFKNTGT